MRTTFTIAAILAAVTFASEVEFGRTYRPYKFNYQTRLDYPIRPARPYKPPTVSTRPPTKTYIKRQLPKRRTAQPVPTKRSSLQRYLSSRSHRDRPQTRRSKAAPRYAPKSAPKSAPVAKRPPSYATKKEVDVH